jgi:hypothetical protein
LIFEKGDELGVFCLDFSDESEDDGEDSEVHLGRVSGAIRHCLF